MESLEQKASDEELLAKSIEEAKIHRRRSYKNFILYGLIPAALLVGASFCLKYEAGMNNLKMAHQECKQVEDKSATRDTVFGRYSCNEIKEFYKKANE